MEAVWSFFTAHAVVTGLIVIAAIVVLVIAMRMRRRNKTVNVE